MYRSNSFDPRPHARGDDYVDSFVAALSGFDPRPHARGDECRLMTT